jgi:hypothetical protein
MAIPSLSKVYPQGFPGVAQPFQPPLQWQSPERRCAIWGLPRRIRPVKLHT